MPALKERGAICEVWPWPLPGEALVEECAQAEHIGLRAAVKAGECGILGGQSMPVPPDPVARWNFIGGWLEQVAIVLFLGELSDIDKMSTIMTAFWASFQVLENFQKVCAHLGPRPQFREWRVRIYYGTHRLAGWRYRGWADRWGWPRPVAARRHWHHHHHLLRGHSGFHRGLARDSPAIGCLSE